MSLALQISDIQDIVTTTIANLGEKRFTVLGQKFRECIVAKHWFSKGVQQASGNGWSENALTQFSGRARHAAPTTPDTVSIPNIAGTISGNYIHADTNVPLIYQEILVNYGPQQIVNLVMMRRVDALGSMVEEFERKAWALPAATNTTDPYGIPYWVVWNATTGFNGGAPSGYTRVGNLDPNLVPNSRWKNYTFQYTAIDANDLLPKWRLAFLKTLWKSPVKAPQYVNGTPDARIWYVSDETHESLVTVQEGRNENLGNNLGGQAAGRSISGLGKGYVDGEMMFRGCPIVNVPLMSDSTEYSGPAGAIYGIDHSAFGVKALAGDFMREGKVQQLPAQHNCYAYFVDCTYNYFCRNRSTQMVGATAAS